MPGYDTNFGAKRAREVIDFISNIDTAPSMMPLMKLLSG